MSLLTDSRIGPTKEVGRGGCHPGATGLQSIRSHLLGAPRRPRARKATLSIPAHDATVETLPCATLP